MTIAKKMTAIADSIRSITGGTDNLTLDDMATDITDVSAQIGNQSDLLAQIQVALDSKGAGANVTIYSGSSVPDSSIGNSGDIYLVV